MNGRAQIWLSFLMVAMFAAAAAGSVWLARATPVIADNLARETALHRESNGVLFYNGGYIDDGDFVLLSELPGADFSRGGVAFVAASEMRTTIMPWTLPPEERALIHNFALGDVRHREVRHFVRLLVEEEGLLEAGGEHTTVILGLSHLMARPKNLDFPLDRYTKQLFERHRLYEYDWDAGIHRTNISAIERSLRLGRDEANRFWRALIERPSTVRPYAATREWRINHTRAIMGAVWQDNMVEEIADLAATIDYLQARNVRVLALYPPIGSWQNEMPYEAAYRALVMPMLEARGVPLADFSGFLEDDEFGDDVHLNYQAQFKVHEAYRALALRQLAEMGITPSPPAARE